MSADEERCEQSDWCGPGSHCLCRPAASGGATSGEALRDALLKHHPIAHTITGPLKGCRCGQVKLGQDVIAHVAAELRAALDGGADRLTWAADAVREVHQRDATEPYACDCCGQAWPCEAIRAWSS